MKKVLITIALILLALLVVGLLVLLISRHHIPQGGTENPQGQNGAGNFPVSSSTPFGTGVPTTKVKDADGTSVVVKDFINTGDTIPDPENPGSYQLAGSLGYCPQNTDCTAAPADDYSIGYNGNENAFTIALLKEPLSASRQHAEQFLMNELGLTKDQMCALNYYVGTPYWVNERYDDANLGFSFCPGATKLP
jgi:hypothetical protein